MTGYTVHTGTSKKFVNGWDRVFSGEADGSAGGSAKAAKSKGTKKKSKSTKKGKKSS